MNVNIRASYFLLKHYYPDTYLDDFEIGEEAIYINWIYILGKVIYEIASYYILG